MLISVVNHTKGKLSDEQVQQGIRAVNRQIAHDFEPYWDFGAELRLEGTIGEQPDDEKLPELRGDAIIYLWDEVDVEDALGYHDLNAAGVPFGFVFTELVKELKEPWTVTFASSSGLASRRGDDRSIGDAARPGRGLRTAATLTCESGRGSPEPGVPGRSVLTSVAEIRRPGLPHDREWSRTR